MKIQKIFILVISVVLFFLSAWAFINGFTLLSSIELTDVKSPALIELIERVRSTIATFMFIVVILWFWAFCHKFLFKEINQ